MRAGPASILLAALGIGSVPMMASARDFGTFGPTWSIAEPDLLAVIKARLEAARQSGKLDAMNQRFVEAAEASVPAPCCRRITPATSDRRWSFDPSVTFRRTSAMRAELDRAGPALQSAEPFESRAQLRLH
jgi:conjugal transfer pilus assembly protein TraW